MTFAHPFALTLLPIPFAGVVYLSRRRTRRAALILQGTVIALIILALGEPFMTLPETRTALVALFDTSASISGQDLARASSIATELEGDRGRNWLRVVPFDTSLRSLSSQEQLNTGVRLRHVSNTSQAGTNLESALAGTVAAFPAGYIPRVLLVSDGNENQGSVARMIAQFEQLQIPVDTIPLGEQTQSGVHVQAISMPPYSYSAEQVPIDLRLVSSRAGKATVDLYADNKPLGHQTVELHAGTNSVRLLARVKTSGVVTVSGSIQTNEMGEAHFDQALELRRAHVLYISEDPTGTDSNLLGALNQANFDVDRNSSELDGTLEKFQLVILNNLDLNSFSAERKTRLEEYVKKGGGLLLIGGERQVYKEDRKLDALDRALPARLAPPDTPKGTCVALIIDKSSSMEGRKIELARVSAIGVVDHLRPIDSIGVLIFDNSFQWAVPMRHAEDKPLIKRLISGITPDGGTQIAPALAEAYRRVLPSESSFKHIVLLTDGISEEGDSFDLAREAAQHGVTISTVGLGQDVNRTYLEKIAASSGGRSYFLNEPAGLEQILLKDVENYSGSTTVEKALTPIVAEKADVLDGVGMETAPPLSGYARYRANPGAETLLEINPAKKDPLFVRWQYGLGRAAVFASDAKSRWAQAWISWPGFDRFWINVTRDLLMHTNASEASADYDEASGDLVVRYRLAAGTTKPSSIPEIYVLGPGGFHRPIELKTLTQDVYEGRLHIGAAVGLFRIRPLEDSILFPEIGLYRPEPEMQDFGSNQQLLRAISTFTHGRFNPQVSEAFYRGNQRRYVEWQLWPACLALAIALSIAELVSRKWKGLVEYFRR